MKTLHQGGYQQLSGKPALAASNARAGNWGSIQGLPGFKPQPCLCVGERGRLQIISAWLLKTPVTEAEQKTQKDVFVNYLFLCCPFFT